MIFDQFTLLKSARYQITIKALKHIKKENLTKEFTDHK